jgi:hypothetical protein
VYRFDTTLLWATFFLRCVSSHIPLPHWGALVIMQPGLQPEWILLLVVVFGCCAAFIPLPWCVFDFGSALLYCVPVPGGVVRS